MSTPPIPPIPGNQPGYQQVILPPAPQAGNPYPPAPSQVYAQPVPPSSSSPVLKIVLVVVGIFVLFGVLAAAVVGYGAYKLSKAVHRAGNGDVSFSTPNGASFTSGSSASISPEDLGLPEYPGAKRASGGMRMKSPTGSLIMTSFTTGDSRAQVVDFYKAKLGDDASVVENDDSTILSSGDKTHDKKVITVSTKGNTTHISIMHTTSAE